MIVGFGIALISEILRERLGFRELYELHFVHSAL
jgi:hypothetical protein